MERVWLLDKSLLESLLDLLQLIVNLTDFVTLLSSRMGLVVVHSLVRGILTKLKHVVQLLDDRVSAIVGRQDWLEVCIFDVGHDVRSSLHCLLDYSLDFGDFLFLHLFGEMLALFVGKEILLWEKFLNDIDDNMFLIGHRLVFNDLVHQIFLELINQRVKAEFAAMILLLDLLRGLGFGLFLIILVIVRILPVVSLNLESAEISEEHKDLRALLVGVWIGESEHLKHLAHGLDSRLVDSTRLRHHDTLNESSHTLCKDVGVVEHVTDIDENLGVCSLLVRVIESWSVNQSNISKVLDLDVFSDSLCIFTGNKGILFIEFLILRSELVLNDGVSRGAFSVSHLSVQKQ